MLPQAVDQDVGGQHLRRRRRAAAGEVRQRAEQPGARRAPRGWPRPPPVQADAGQVAVDLDHAPLRPRQRRELVLRLGEPRAAEPGGDQRPPELRRALPRRQQVDVARPPAAGGEEPRPLQGGELEAGERHAQLRRHAPPPAGPPP